jgi:ABC-type antimicrobial peptide transport system permease subunit
MLIANGMSRLKVSMMIIVESVFSVTLASILGLVIGALVISYFGHYGMDFSPLAQGFESQGWSKVVYPVLYAEDYIKVFICSCISGLLGAVIPAYRAVRLNIVSIIRR